MPQKSLAGCPLFALRVDNFSGRDRLAAFLPRIVPMNRAVSPSPGPSDRLLPVGEGKSVRPPAAGSWVGDQVAAVNDTDSCSTGVTGIFLTHIPVRKITGMENI